MKVGDQKTISWEGIVPSGQHEHSLGMQEAQLSWRDAVLLGVQGADALAGVPPLLNSKVKLNEVSLISSFSLVKVQDPG